MPDLEGGYEVIYDAQLQHTSTGGPFRPGQVFVHRSGTDRKQWSLVKWVLLDNNGCSRGEALVTDFAQTVEHGVKKSATDDAWGPQHFRGCAGGTIASNKYGFSVISGYCEQADCSHTVASGELLTISGSTAGKLTPNSASSYWSATVGLSSTTGTAPFAFAIGRAAFGTGVGSVQILGNWA